VVKAPNGVLALLAHIAIADDLASARQALESYRGKNELTVVTRAGEVLHRYLLRGGSDARQSRIELLAERDEARVELEQVSVLVEQLTAQQQELRESLDQEKQREQQLRQQLREREKLVVDQAQTLNRLRGQVE